VLEIAALKMAVLKMAALEMTALEMTALKDSLSGFHCDIRNMGKKKGVKKKGAVMRVELSALAGWIIGRVNNCQERSR